MLSSNVLVEAFHECPSKCMYIMCLPMGFSKKRKKLCSTVFCFSLYNTHVSLKKQQQNMYNQIYFNKSWCANLSFLALVQLPKCCLQSSCVFIVSDY